MSPLRLAAPAKLNLTLAVLGERPDGYHELATTMLALDRADLLELERREAGIELSLGGPARGEDVPLDERNLAWRAVEVVRDLVPGAPGVRLHLEKHVPSQAGLGGGSSDAAAAALGTLLLLELDPARHAAEVARRLAGLGSDCAFFFQARASGVAHCLGRGERVEVLPFAPSERRFLVLCPRVACPTAAVYAALADGDPCGGEPVLDLARWLALPLDRARACLFNDLEAAAVRVAPELAAWRALFDEADAGHVRLCGSGSSFFGLFPDAASAEAAERALRLAAKARHLALRDAFTARAAGAGAHALSSK